jgi:asparagine synthase (glutamine-hydrolysing)
MVRCHTYRDRPGQCDPLHVDLWWRGVNVLRDCGTFQYYVAGRPDVEEYFSSAAAHNTVEIDGAEPFERMSKFLWFPWPRAKVRRFETGGEAPRFEGERFDYDRRPWSVVHRRTVIARADELWEIEDELISRGDGGHTSVMRWHFCDAPFEVDASRAAMELRTQKGVVRIGVDVGRSTLRRFGVIRGRDEPGRVQGFASDVYGERFAIPTLEVEVSGEWPIRVVTRIGLG